MVPRMGTYRFDVRKATARETLMTESNLLRHARSELRPLLEHEDPLEREVAESVLAAVEGFCRFEGHSGGSHAVALHWLTRLLSFQNLGPLTDDPDEWIDVDDDFWQSRRCAEAFSTDGGKTYRLLSEDRWVGWGRRGPWRRRLVSTMHRSASAASAVAAP